jgi:lysophospholipase L1-like esterase
MKKTRIALLASAAFLAASAGRAQGPDFTNYVALGDSLTAGWQSGCLVDRYQVRSYPAVIAQQTGHVVALPGDSDLTHFQQPLGGEPGIPQPCYTLNFSPNAGFSFDFHTGEPGGQPENALLARPYNNLGLPGAHSYDLLAVTSSPPPPAGDIYTLILRNFGGSPLAGTNAVQQAIAQTPTFVTVWIGNNDVLDAAASATVISPSCGAINGDPAGHCDGFVAPNGSFVPLTLTPLDFFTTNYTTILQTLRGALPDATIAVANVPNVTAIPFTTTLPPVVINPLTQQPVLHNGQPIPLIGQFHDGTVGPIPPDTLVTLGAAPLEQMGFGIPCAIYPTEPPPFCNQPLPDGGIVPPGGTCNGQPVENGGLCEGVLLFADEVAYLEQRVTDINSAIATAAAGVNAKVIDTFALLNDINANGRSYAGVTVTTQFIKGGLFSYDGVHPSNAGYTIIADEMIQFFNAQLGAHVPRPNVYAALFVPDQPLSGSEPARGLGLRSLYPPGVWQRLLETLHPANSPVKLIRVDNILGPGPAAPPAQVSGR